MPGNGEKATLAESDCSSGNLMPSGFVAVTPTTSLSSTVTTPLSTTVTPPTSAIVTTPPTPLSKHPPFPSPFPIPDFWGEDVDSVLKEKRVTPHVRKEIVKTLSCSLKVYCSNGRPTRAQCNAAAMELVRKYPFLRDPIGSETVRYLLLFLMCFKIYIGFMDP